MRGNLFRKQLVAVPAAPSRNGNGEQSQNPYLDARRVWNSQIDRAFGNQHVWQLVAIASLLVALAAVVGVVYIGSQSKFVPYVIEVDKLGDSVAVGPAQLAGRADPRVVRASLAAFISSARLVTPDLDLQRKAIFTAFGMLHSKDPATQKMTEFLGDESDTSPFKRATKVTVNCDGFTVLPITDNAWQVEWQETTRDRDGGLAGKPISMRATVEVYFDPPGADARQDVIQRNPLGIYVRDFSWQQR
jgi:type IV secretion system protein VirB5